MTPEQFSYLSTLAGVLPTLWVALAVIAVPRQTLRLPRSNRSFYLFSAIGINLVLPAIGETAILLALLNHADGAQFGEGVVSGIANFVTWVAVIQMAGLVSYLGFAIRARVLDAGSQPPVDQG